MKNIERYKEDLIDLIVERLAVTKENEVAECYYLECYKCIFSDEEGNCVKDARRWLDEECKEPPILNKAEKEYLENVLRPFKDDIKWICKVHHQYSGTDQLIDNNGIQYYCLNPQCFKDETICKGMELGEEDTLENLKLFENE